jgi:hypothetical protein
MQKDEFALEASQSPDGKKITLKWDLPTGFIPERIIIYKSIGVEPLTIYKTLEGNDQFYIDLDIEINVRYNYRLSVFDKMNEGVIGSKIINICADKK